MANEQVQPKFKANQRVRRTSQPWCLGTVKAVREEAIVSAVDVREREKALMYQVLWDNGTLSYFGPDSIEASAE